MTCEDDTYGRASEPTNERAEHMEIVRPGALYKQVAHAIRDGITSGEYPPGTMLPSETQLIERYQVSRPTVRNAIAELRTQGLVDVIHGKGSFVRATPTGPATTIERTITKTGSRYQLPDQDWTEAEEPTVYRTKTDTTTGLLLRLDEGEALFAVDRLLADPSTGVRALHRTLIPFEVAEGTPLADEPAESPAKIYALLATAGHAPLSWHETVRARMPQPDERATLDLPEATPLLHIYRTTFGNGDRPLILEELRASAGAVQLGYRLTVTKGTSKRS